MKIISILNFYGMKNIGDGAIYQSAIDLIDETVDTPIEVHTHAVDTDIPELLTKKDKIYNRNLLSPYGYAISGDNKRISNFKKVAKMMVVLFGSTIVAIRGLISPRLLPKNGFYYYITSIYVSSAVLNIGGGYLRTKEPYKDFFGLTLTLLPIFIAKIYGKKLLFLPMSFGNFASKLHADFSATAIDGSTFIARDHITLKDLHSNQIIGKSSSTRLHYIPDIALFLYGGNRHDDDSDRIPGNYSVITAREWMSETKQEAYEATLTKIIDYLYSTHQIKTVFLPMVHNDIEDNDFNVANRLQQKVKDKASLTIVEVEMPSQVQQILTNAKFSICTRMHSAILSATVLTPHIGIAYEHKMHGYMNLMGLSDWVTDIDSVNYEELVEKVDRIMDTNEYQSYKTHLEDKIKLVQDYKSDLVTIMEKFI